MQLELVHGAVDASALIGLHREARRLSPSYFDHMRKVALRHGREALAARYEAAGAVAAPVVAKGCPAPAGEVKTPRRKG